MGEWMGRDIDADVTGIAHGGFGVARVDGRVVFIADAIPGERVRARVNDDSKKNFWRADAVEILEASPHRIPHVWHAASLEVDPDKRAGGADFGHIALPHQRQLKRDVITDSLARFGKLSADTIESLLGDVDALPGDDESQGLGWRSRVRLHVDDRGRIGPRARRSHSVIQVPDLPLASAGINEIAPLDQYIQGIETVDILSPSVGDPRMIVGEQKPMVIREMVGDREFRLDDQGFWQVHREAPMALTRAVQDAILPEKLDPAGHNLDLYGGVGLLAAALAEVGGKSTRITSVEFSPRATDHASENLADWLGATAATEKVDKWLRGFLATQTAGDRERLRQATIILDPPRAGTGREVMDLVTGAQPAQVIYVACDPVALSRDIAYAAEAGYRPVFLRALDMFPHTHHVETVVTLVRD
ncbi:MAG: class I SAM-dependent RNA methyltransferase [Microbacteriaceae bacterium]